MTSESEAWNRRRYAIDQSRLGEYTPEALKAKYRGLDHAAVQELTSLPTLFAYEAPLGAPARVGRVSKIGLSSTSAVRFHFELAARFPSIPAEILSELSWDLDIGELELNRTHWAIKDVDLLEVLIDAKVIGPELVRRGASRGEAQSKVREGLMVRPTVFAVPKEEPQPDLVSLMMPFEAGFDSVSDAVQAACHRAGSKCERADDIWEESTIIQDVFNLIHRSQIVVVDLSGRNGNVLYETGIAHTLGRPVVPISQSGGELPFDIAHHRTLFYLANREGLKSMSEKLERRLKRLASRGA